MRFSGYLAVGILTVASMLAGTAVAQHDHDWDDHHNQWKNSAAYQAGVRDGEQDRDRNRHDYSHRHDWDRDNDRQAYQAGYNAALQQHGYNRNVNAYRGNYGNNGYGNYAGRLNSHDQSVYDQLYNNYLQARSINAQAQVQKAETAMQTVYRKYGIPSNTPYNAVASGGPRGW